MTSSNNGGRLFLTLGLLLLLLGIGLRPHLLPLTTWPPFLIPGIVALAYGAGLLWRHKHPLE